MASISLWTDLIGFSGTFGEKILLLKNSAVPLTDPSSLRKL